MPAAPLFIYTNTQLPALARDMLNAGIAPHILTDSLHDADIAFGQPDAAGVMQSARLRWVHIGSAGYTRYDTPEFRAALAARGAQLTNSSSVHAEPCAEHALSLILAHARQLPQSFHEQRTTRGWPDGVRRAASRLLVGQRLVIFGFGAIARRLVDLLAPFHMRIAVVRRQPTGDEGIPIVSADALGDADHVVNILPDNPATRGFFNGGRFAGMQRGAIFYNIGRGTTVEQPALIDALRSGRLGAAYLDVTDPEPLPPDHPLWTTPNCFITPHTAGGFGGEETALVQHFLENLARFTAGTALADRVM
jgi:phosphoglycerate dehydrogenase-like enzyme